jgi:hypothetical protein
VSGGAYSPVSSARLSRPAPESTNRICPFSAAVFTLRPGGGPPGFAASNGPQVPPAASQSHPSLRCRHSRPGRLHALIQQKLKRAGGHSWRPGEESRKLRKNGRLQASGNRPPHRVYRQRSFKSRFCQSHVAERSVPCFRCLLAETLQILAVPRLRSLSVMIEKPTPEIARFRTKFGSRQVKFHS